MKNPTQIAKGAMLALAATVLTVSASAQTTTFTAGDILIGFRAASGVGASTTFVYNVGSSVGFRDNGNQGALANVGAQLSSIYGASWFTRADVSWGAIGVRDNNPPAGNPAVDGDPTRTVYATKGATGINTTTPWGPFTGTQVGSASTTIRGFTDIGSEVAGTFAAQTAAAGTNGFGAFVGTEKSNNWAAYTSPTADFGLFTGGVEGTFGTGAGSAYLDLYRILAGTVGANPTGTVGLGSYETTFIIDAAGAISASAVPIPEPSTYAAILGAATLAFVGYRRMTRKGLTVSA